MVATCDEVSDSPVMVKWWIPGGAHDFVATVNEIVAPSPVTGVSGLTENSTVTVSGTPLLVRATALPTPLIKDNTRSNSADSPTFMTVGVSDWRMLMANSIGAMVGVGVGMAVGVAVAAGTGVGIEVGVGTGVGVKVGDGTGVGRDVGAGTAVDAGVGAATGIIMNGPRCTVLVQLPALSTVLR